MSEALSRRQSIFIRQGRKALAETTRPCDRAALKMASDENRRTAMTSAKAKINALSIFRIPHLGAPELFS
jgi:uncharacterized membrane protein